MDLLGSLGVHVATYSPGGRSEPPAWGRSEDLVLTLHIWWYQG